MEIKCLTSGPHVACDHPICNVYAESFLSKSDNTSGPVKQNLVDGFTEKLAKNAKKPTIFNFWSQLPMQFQKDVVKQLDYKSRCCLRKCSKSDRDLVEKCPLNMSYITIKTDRTYNPKIKELEEQVVFSIFAENWKCTNLHGVDNFLSIFHSRRSIAQSFWFDYFDENKPCVSHFVDDLAKEIEKRGGSQCKIRARKIQWNNSKQTTVYPKGKVSRVLSKPDPGIHFLRLLKFFDSKILKSLDIVKSNFTSSTISLLAKSEYWWLLKELSLELQQKTMIELFLTVQKLQYTSQSFSGNEIWKVIQSFQSRSLPYGSYFQLSAHKPWDMEDVLASIPVPIRNEPIGLRRNPFIKHTQRFPIRSGEMVLVVKLNSETVKGVVCRTNFIEDDYGKDSEL